MSTGVLRLGDVVVHDGAEHTVVGLTGTSVRLADDDGAVCVVTLAHMQCSPGFAVRSGSPLTKLAAVGLLDAVPTPVLERARWWERHIVEVETGRVPLAGSDSPPSPAYDPAVHTLAEREAAKAAELQAQGEQVSQVTIRRRRRAYREAGLWGLVDQRRVRTSSPTGRVDPRVIAAARQAVAEQTTISTGTRTGLSGASRSCWPARTAPMTSHFPPERRSTGCWPAWLRAGTPSGRPRPAAPWPTGRRHPMAPSMPPGPASWSRSTPRHWTSSRCSTTAWSAGSS